MIETGQFRTSNSTPIGSAAPPRLPSPLPQPPLNNVPTTAGVEQQLVQVWFGEHVVCAYRGEVDAAQRYAAAIGRRFAGLRVTVDPPPAAPTARTAPPLPSERMWELVP
jgi:hypothetical protein